MVILSVDIRRFGKLTGFKADFDPYFNLIDGANETGKSTIASFILYMLYGFDDQAEAAVSERCLRAPWDGEEAGGSMTVEENNTKYLIERSAFLDENGKRDTLAVTDLVTGIREEGGVAPGERFLGVPREVFAATAFFTADAVLRADGALLTRAIENIIFSADERHSTVGAMYTLGHAARQISSQDGKSGVLVSLEKQSEALEERLGAVKEKEQLLIEKENVLYTTKEKRRECERMLADAHRLQIDYNNVLIIRDYDRLHELEDSADERRRALEELEEQTRRRGFLPDSTYLTELATVKSEMDRAVQGVTAAEQTLADLERVGSQVTEDERALVERVRAVGSDEDLRLKYGASRTKARRHVALLSVFYSLALLLLGGAVTGYFLLGTPALLAVLALSLAFCGVGFVSTVELIRACRFMRDYRALAAATSHEAFFSALSSVTDAERRQASFEAKHASAVEALARAQDAHAAATERLAVTFGRWRDDLRVDEHYAETFEALKQEVAAYIRHFAELVNQKETADKEVAFLYGYLREHDEVAVRALVPPDKREQIYKDNDATNLRNAIVFYEKQLESFTKQEEELTAELAGFDRRESSAAVEEELIALDKRIASLREYALLCTEAEELLRGGAERLRGEISPCLSRYTSSLLYTLTDGKYTDLEIGDDFSLYIVTENDKKPIDYLSHGTKELTYFSLRMALVDLLYRTGVPVCLDETFAHQDDDRAMAFMQSLRMLASEGKQCFLFSCHEREKDLADSVFATYRRITMR